MGPGCMRGGFRWDAGGVDTALRRDMRVKLRRRSDLREFCNLGYAEGCGRLPQERVWDSVRFAARTVSDGNGVMRLHSSSLCVRAWASPGGARGAGV